MNLRLVIPALATVLACQSNADSNHDHGWSEKYFGSYEVNNIDTRTVIKVTVDSAAQTRNILSNAVPNIPTGPFPSASNPNTIIGTRT